MRKNGAQVWDAASTGLGISAFVSHMPSARAGSVSTSTHAYALFSHRIFSQVSTPQNVRPAPVNRPISTFATSIFTMITSFRNKLEINAT